VVLGAIATDLKLRERTEALHLKVEEVQERNTEEEKVRRKTAQRSFRNKGTKVTAIAGKKKSGNRLKETLIAG